MCSPAVPPALMLYTASGSVGYKHTRVPVTGNDLVQTYWQVGDAGQRSVESSGRIFDGNPLRGLQHPALAETVRAPTRFRRRFW